MNLKKFTDMKKLCENLSQHRSKPGLVSTKTSQNQDQGRTLSDFISWGCKLSGFGVKGPNLDFTIFFSESLGTGCARLLHNLESQKLGLVSSGVLDNMHLIQRCCKVHKFCFFFLLPLLLGDLVNK